MITDPREARLPAWAQKLIADLRAEITGLNDELADAIKAAQAARLATAPNTAPITVDGPDGLPIGLPFGLVSFYLEKDIIITVSMADDRSTLFVDALSKAAIVICPADKRSFHVGLCEEKPAT